MIPAMSTLVDQLLPEELWQRVQPAAAGAGPARRRGPTSSERFQALAMLACSAV
jgi:hypothetical protein